MIDEANLLDIAASHLSAPVTSEVGVSIVSTDGLRAAYISPDFQSDAMAVDGDNADWVGSELNPSDDAMPGELTENFYVTYTENDDLYVAIDGLDLSTSDLWCTSTSPVAVRTRATTTVPPAPTTCPSRLTSSTGPSPTRATTSTPTASSAGA